MAGLKAFGRKRGALTRVRLFESMIGKVVLNGNESMAFIYFLEQSKVNSS